MDKLMLKLERLYKQLEDKKKQDDDNEEPVYLRDLPDDEKEFLIWYRVLDNKKKEYINNLVKNGFDD